MPPSKIVEDEIKKPKRTQSNCGDIQSNARKRKVTIEVKDSLSNELKLAKILMDKPAPHVTAQSWLVLDTSSRQILFGKMEKERKEIASLTKIMTIYTCLKMIEKFRVSLAELIEISPEASQVQGTSAMLVEGDKLTVEQLLYGMMLPSGNDAAYALASYFGSLILLNEDEFSEDLDCTQWVMSINQIRGCLNPYTARLSQFEDHDDIMCFLAEMNKNCLRLHLRSSFFDSPHGMANFNNKSTAFDIAKLCSHCFAMPLFCQIVKTKFYVVLKSKSGNQRTYRWENTQKLLGEPGVSGIKTGITQSAGPCLATSI